MNNKIETLRAICFTSEDIRNIKNLGDSFTEKDIEFMVEFKKIYELGTIQLQKFIDKLDSEGKELDEYSIMYYVSILRNGPLGVYVRELSKDKQYFGSLPDCLGLLGNINVSNSSISIIPDTPKSLGCAVDTYNKLPDFVHKNIQLSNQSEEVFRTSLNSSLINDNTLPLIDKFPENRYNEEPSGLWRNKPNASYMMKDASFIDEIKKVSGDIFDKIKNSLGEENNRVFAYTKTYSPFNPEKNNSTSINSKVVKNIKLGDVEQEEELDLLGDVIDSVERRGSLLRISTDDKNDEYALHTNKGQLGS